MRILRLVRVAFLKARRKVRRRMVLAERRRIQKLLAIRIDPTPRFDERSTIDRFRRESGQP